MSDNFVFQWSPSQGTTYSDDLSDVMAAERRRGSSVKGLAAPQRVEEEVEEDEPSWREQFSSMLSAYWGDDEAAKGTFTSPDQPMYDPEMEVYDEYAKAGERTAFDSSPTPDTLKPANREAAPTVDTRSNEVLDKPPADVPDAETPMPAPSEVKEEGLMADPRGNKRPRARPSNLNLDAPINVRNNNLGNIKNIKRNDWKGQTNLGSDETFASFSSPELGIRALKKVIQANINATSTIEEYVNRYASEPKEKAYYKENGKLMPHLQNYAIQIAESQGLKNIKEDIPEDVNMLEWIKATAKAEGGADALTYFTDDVIERGLKL